MREACGILAISSDVDVASVAIMGLISLQHRGQEGAGIASFNGERKSCTLMHQAGLMGNVFLQKDRVKHLSGNRIIGHVRYSTSQEKNHHGSQPIHQVLSPLGDMVCAHNGQLSNTTVLEKQWNIKTFSDTQLIVELCKKHSGDTLKDILLQVLPLLEGGFAFAFGDHEHLIGIRDPWGIRPLVLGRLANGWVLASETCALEAIGARIERDIRAGEMLIIPQNKAPVSIQWTKHPTYARPCAFEAIYFSRPDSIISSGDGKKNVYSLRKRMGSFLAKEAPVVADMVVPVPDSGIPAAIGYAAETSLPLEMIIVRSHYAGRTFISPTEQERKQQIFLKHNMNRLVARGCSLILVDDSLVRGHTSKRLITMLREGGAKDIHLRIASPPIMYTDHYGIDISRKDELLALRLSLEDMRDFLSLDSLAFLSIDGFYRAMGYRQGRNDQKPQMADHCFTGSYPVKPLDVL